MQARFLRFTAAIALAVGTALLSFAAETLQLDKVTVFAGVFPTGEQPGAVLNSLEVVQTPGATADINRALQTLPGIQFPDEGNALFVRGGDSFETITLVNGLRYPTAQKLTNPSGTFTGTLNPFQAQRITFASGGFGARFGNALSGIVDLDTLGMPYGRSAQIGGGLGAISAGVNTQLGEHSGVRLMATRFNANPIFRLNGATRDYPEAPNGHDFAATAAWEYRPGAELRVFGVEQLQHLKLNVNLPAQRGLFANRTRNRLGTVSWSDTFGRLSANVAVGGGTLDRRETVGTVDIETITDHRQFAGRVGYELNDRVTFSAGADGARDSTTLAKFIPPSGTFAGSTFRAELPGTRWGVFGETDAVLAPHVRAIAGLRVDDSSLTQRTTVDPRLSLAWEPRKKLALSLAGGVYHQVADAYDFITDTGRITLPPMRVEQLIAALQLGKGDQLFRVETYAKDYRDLVTLNRAYRPVGGGDGTARGVDVFAKTKLFWAMSGRLTYGFVDTRRTDPDSGRMAPAPFDVTHTATLIVDRAFSGWVTGAAVRYASGRPFTPIVGGTPNGRGGFSPVYGPAFSQRMPSLFRLDLNTSRYFRLNPHTALVLYASINNVLNRANVYAWEYSDDFATRSATPSIFGRSLYFGFSLMFN